MNLPLFDTLPQTTGEALKRAGMKRAAANKNELLTLAREIAVELAGILGTVTADDVQLELHRRGHSTTSLGNAAGSLFLGGQWQWTGEFKKSVRAISHGNLLRCWRLRK